MSSIHQEMVFNAKPQRVYEILMDSALHAEMTGGGAADISRDVGGEFSCHGGGIVGRNVELVESQRIVQAWRVANWDPGVYTLVRFELRGEGGKTRVVLDHTGVPEEAKPHLEAGWHARYWEPLTAYLAK